MIYITNLTRKTYFIVGKLMEPYFNILAILRAIISLFIFRILLQNYKISFNN